MTYIVSTYVVMCLITLILVEINEEWAIYWAIGIPALIIYILLYPVRAWNAYSRSINYYKKRDITRLQYLLGRRATKNTFFWKATSL